jgi:hypothetical protein
MPDQNLFVQSNGSAGSANVDSAENETAVMDEHVTTEKVVHARPQTIKTDDYRAVNSQSQLCTKRKASTAQVSISLEKSETTNYKETRNYIGG